MTKIKESIINMNEKIDKAKKDLILNLNNAVNNFIHALNGKELILPDLIQLSNKKYLDCRNLKKLNIPKLKTIQEINNSYNDANN